MSQAVDVAIIGGGFAALSAALLMARARLSVAIVHRGPLRNAAAHASHGFITHDGAAPGDIWKSSKLELESKYAEYVRWIEGEVVSVENKSAPTKIAFLATLADGTTLHARRLFLATGSTDKLPDVTGLTALWGKKAHMCPYCDAFEYGAKARLGVMVADEKGLKLATLMSNWSPEVTVFVDTAKVTPKDLHPTSKVLPLPEEFTWSGNMEDSITVYVPDESSPNKRKEVVIDGVFLQTTHQPQAQLATQLGAELTYGFISIDVDGMTTVPGVAASGDVAWPKGGQMPLFQVAQAVGFAARSAGLLCNSVIMENIKEAIAAAKGSA